MHNTYACIYGYIWKIGRQEGKCILEINFSHLTSHYLKLQSTEAQSACLRSDDTGFKLNHASLGPSANHLSFMIFLLITAIILLFFLFSVF